MNAQGEPPRPVKGDAYVQHEMHRTLFLHAMGGPISTGGLGAVALRCDHGLQSFRDKVLPLVRSRGIKVSQAYNPRNWHYPENSTVSPADLNSWVKAGDVEIWNHSANHWGVTDQKGMHDQIVGGLSEIQQQLPAAKGAVWGFAPPSVSKGDYLGFRNGATPSRWDTYTGRLILRHHAIASAYLPGTAQRVLDGQMRDGLGHVTIERLDATEIKKQIDIAAEQRTGFQMMLHPSQLDAEGKLTSSGLEEVLDYLVELRNSGRIVTLSPYQLMVADSRNTSSRTPGPWTNLNDLLATGIDPQAIRLRRADDAVHLDVSKLHLASNAFSLLAQPLPAQFRPIRPQFINLHTNDDGSAELEIKVDGGVIVRGPIGTTARGSAAYWLS